MLTFYEYLFYCGDCWDWEIAGLVASGNLDTAGGARDGDGCLITTVD
jgi:hypothetical protein